MTQRSDEFIEVDWKLRAKNRRAARHRNSPERKAMLAARRRGQESRHGQRWVIGVEAWKNRRTGKPHTHARQTARHLLRKALGEQSNAAAQR